jgi:hypothetical protein
MLNVFPILISPELLTISLNEPSSNGSSLKLKKGLEISWVAILAPARKLVLPVLFSPTKKVIGAKGISLFF